MSLRHITDQIAHFVTALLILAIASVATIWAGALAGLALGLIRETAEAGGSRITLAELLAHFRKRDPWIDLAFWSLGGAVAAAII